MFVKLLCIVFSAVVLNVVENARILDRVKRESLKVRITAKDDSIVFQYLAPDPAIKLRGYILGYGGRYSKQNISLPDNGEPIELDVEFTPKYLIAVHPVAEYSRAAALKRCKGSVELHQPLQVMINALTSTSVLLSWGQNYEEECNGDVDSECTDERHFTVRYREKEKNRKWMYQFCPTTNTVVDKLRPNTAYEFGVRVTKPKEDSIWSKTTARTTTVTTSPSNTRTQQMRINVLHPYGNIGKSKNTRNRQMPGGDHQNSGKARRKSAVITSAPGTDPSVFMKTNRNPPSKAHNSMELNPQPENEVVNKEEKNVIDPKGTKMDKTGKTKPKTAGSPSKANESTRPSSVNTSFSSNPGLELHATGKPQFIVAEFQVPSSNHSNLFTSERDSDLETKDKQHSTESEIPPSTKIPFTILSTTSKLTAEDKQKLPEIKAPSSTNSFLNTSDPVHASDLVDNKQSKEPEAPHSSRSSIQPTSEPDAKDMEKLTEPAVTFSSISSSNSTTETGSLGTQKFTDFEIPTSFFSISKLTSTLDVTDGQKSTEKVTELERPSSNGNFYSIPSSTSEHDTTDEQFSERGVTSSSSSFFTTSSAELDPAERQPDSEDEIRSSSSSSFNGLNTLKPDVLDKEKNTGFGVPSSSNSFPFTANTSERNVLGNQKSTELEASSSTSSVFITSNTHAEADVIKHNPFTEYNPPLANNAPRTEPDYQDKQPITGRKPSTAGTPHEFSGSSASGLDKLEDNSSPDRKLSTAKTSHVFSGTGVSEVDNLADNNPTDPERSTSDTVQVFRPSQLDSTGEKKRKGTDPAADSSSSKPKNKSNAKWNVLETSAGVQSSTSSNPFSEKDAVRPATQTNPYMFTENSEVENATVFSLTPISEIDSLGKERYTGPHVIYFGKNPNVPCSINEALKYFVEKNHTNVKVMTIPRYSPTNVTILTVEGCSTFVIVVWEKNDNDSATEFELVSTALGPDNETEKIVIITNQTHSVVENLSPNTSYMFIVKPKNKLGVGPPSDPVPFVTESADPRVSEYVPGKAAIWSPYRFKFDSFSQCQGKQYVKRTWYRKFVGIILCNSLRYKIYLSDKLSGVFYNIGDLSGHGEDHCQFVDSFLDGRTGHHLLSAQLPVRQGFYRSLRQEPVMFGTIGGYTHISYVHWYECGIAIPGKW